MKLLFKILRALTIVFFVVAFLLILAAIWSPGDEQVKLVFTGFLFLIAGGFASISFT